MKEKRSKVQSWRTALNRYEFIDMSNKNLGI